MTTSTLYPKIGKFSDIVYRCRELNKTTFSLVGTVKLHGTHADIVFEGGSFRLQSRNRLDLDLETDNYDFAKFAIPLRRRILALKAKYVARYRSLNPDTPLLPECPLVIAGEWCGKGIQKKVALERLPRRHFVIVSVQINGAWVPDTDYADIADESVDIYNISKAGFFYHDVNLDAVNVSENKIAGLVEKVEKNCPYALTFGISGPGEGIVWKVRDVSGDPEFWFKSKGAAFAVKATNPDLDLSKLQASDRAKEFADLITTENRMQQGWSFLLEMGIPQDATGTKRFLNWLVQDCLTEEERDIVASEIDKKRLQSAICLKGKTWYTDKVQREHDEARRIQVDLVLDAKQLSIASRKL